MSAAALMLLSNHADVKDGAWSGGSFHPTSTYQDGCRSGEASLVPSCRHYPEGPGSALVPQILGAYLELL